MKVSLTVMLVINGTRREKMTTGTITVARSCTRPSFIVKRITNGMKKDNIAHAATPYAITRIPNRRRANRFIIWSPLRCLIGNFVSRLTYSEKIPRERRSTYSSHICPFWSAQSFHNYKHFTSSHRGQEGCLLSDIKSSAWEIQPFSSSFSGFIHDTQSNTFL